MRGRSKFENLKKVQKLKIPNELKYLFYVDENCTPYLLDVTYLYFEWNYNTVAVRSVKFEY